MIGKPILGIMTCKINKVMFYEKNFFKTLQRLGTPKNIFVYIFHPDYIDWKKKIVKAFRFNEATQQWSMNWYPLPHYVYDRCFYTSANQYLKYKPFVNKLKQNSQIKFLGNGLKGKWEIHQILSSNQAFNKFLPKSEIFKSNNQLIQWLSQYPVILKPTGGSHGQGVIRISIDNQHYSIIGRNHVNKKIDISFHDKRGLFEWINQFVKGKKYLIQQYLSLVTSDNKPFDIRILIQKNEVGNWEVTGKAARIGDPSNITSNLHGGGIVEDAEALIIYEFGEEKSKQILKEIDKLSSTIHSYIESLHGKLFEVGLDIGVDRQGNIWIIEVNSKPGRRVFELLHDKEKVLKSLSQPILYTEYLMKQRKHVKASFHK